MFFGISNLNLLRPDVMRPGEIETIYRGVRFGRDVEQALPQEYQGFEKARMSLWGRLRQRLKYLFLKV